MELSDKELNNIFFVPKGDQIYIEIWRQKVRAI